MCDSTPINRPNWWDEKTNEDFMRDVLNLKKLRNNDVEIDMKFVDLDAYDFVLFLGQYV